MFERKQSQPKLDSIQRKYLVINSAVVLDAIITSRIFMEDDLVIRQLEEGTFSIFKDGKQIIEFLDKLTSDYGYALVLYSDGSEHQIIQALGELNEACKRNGLTGFPKVTATLVKDCEAFPQVRAAEPRVNEVRPHGILIVIHILEFQKETEFIDMVSKVIHMSKSDHNSYAVLDNRSFFIKKANQEGWNAFDTSSIPLKKILSDLYMKEDASNNQRHQERLKEYAQEDEEEEEKESIQMTNSRSKLNSTSLPQTFEIQPQYSTHLQPSVKKSSFDLKKTFVGRECELTQLKKHFSCNAGIVRCVIVGGAGLGKSQLAVEYLIRNQKEMYSEIVWLDAAQGDSIVNQIRTYLERRYKIDFDAKDENSRTAMIKKFYQILIKDDSEMNKSPKKACVVFDSADGMAQIADYLPDQNSYQNLRFDILITTRYRKWEKLLDNMIELHPFEIEDTKTYILISFPDSKIDQDDDCLSIEAAKLNDLVDGLPLAISLAITYMEQKGISISDFCDSFLKENSKEDESHESQKVSKKAIPSQEEQDELKTLNIISTIFALILPDIRLQSCNTESILDILPYLSPHNITTALLEDYLMKNYNSRMKDFDQALAFVLPYLAIITIPIYAAQTQFEESEKISTESINETNLKVNPLILKAIRLTHRKSGVYQRIYEFAFDWIVDQLNYDKTNMKDVKRAGSFVIHGIYLESFQNDIDELKMIELFEKIGKHQLYGVGNYEIAVKYYDKALVIKEKHYGKDHPETGATLTSLANVWGLLRNYHKKRDFLTRALEINEKHYGRDHPETGATLTNLGNACGCLGNYDKHRDFLTRAVEINERHYGKDHAETGATLASLGKAWGYLGNYEKQRDLLTRALEINERYYGKDHAETGATLTNLGDAWGSLGDYDKQRDLLIKALQIKEKHYGKDHPSTAATLASLGNAWGSLGNYDKQRDLLTRALDIIEKHYGEDHAETGATLTSLGNGWGSLGKYDKQRDLLTRALEIIEKRYGKEHPKTGITLRNLGNAWGSLGDYDKQRDLLTRALEIIEKHYGKEHLQTGIVLDNLGNAWGQLGEYEKQKELLIRTLEIKKKFYGESHPQTSLTLNNLANAWEGLGEYNQQKELLIQAFEIKETYYGKDHLSTGITLGNLGRAWGNLGEQKKQIEFLSRAFEIFEKNYGKNHIKTGTALFNLGDAWKELGNYEKQKDVLVRALEIFEKHYGRDHSQTITILEDLVNAWKQLGNYEKRNELLIRVTELKEKHDSGVIPTTESTQTVLDKISVPVGYMRSTTKNLRSDSNEHSSPTLNAFKKDSKHPSEVDPSGSTESHINLLDYQ